MTTKSINKRPETVEAQSQHFRVPEVQKTLIGFGNLWVMEDFGERCFGRAMRAKARLERMRRKEM